jgi:hypothetical protein
VAAATCVAACTAGSLVAMLTSSDKFDHAAVARCCARRAEISVALPPKRDSGGCTSTISRALVRPTFRRFAGEGRTSIRRLPTSNYVSTRA